MTKGTNNNSKYLIFGGIALVVLAVLALAPQLVAGAFPLLLVLVCPLMMVFMMGSGMHGHGGMQQPHSHNPQFRQSALPPGSNTQLTPEEKLAELKQQLFQLQFQQEGLAQQIGRLEDENIANKGRVSSVAGESVSGQANHKWP